MNPLGQISEAKEKVPASEMVEVVVETEAEAGASGYSVTGGGKKGIFVKDVLKDSPAAKHLSLQKGDQLLSAQVYFDNVKYEDALKILQCAEPYKVSFLLKRTIPGLDVSTLPRAASFELKGPKAKMPKMSFRSKRPFKARKLRAGRFGLKRLKENKQIKARREIEKETSPAKLEFSPMDVEFVFPKLHKPPKVGIEPMEGEMKFTGYGPQGGGLKTEKKKMKIRFPKMKLKQANIEEGNIEGGIKDTDKTKEKVKVKQKAPGFGIAFTKAKDRKLDSSEEKMEVKSPEIKFRPPSVEFDFGVSSQSDADAIKTHVKEKDGLKFQPPKVELSMGLLSAKADDALHKKGQISPKVSKEDIKSQKGHSIGEGIKIEIGKFGFGSGPTAEDELGSEDGKTKKAKLQLPEVELPRYSLDKKKVDKVPEGKEKVQMPSIDITAPKFDLHLLVGKDVTPTRSKTSKADRTHEPLKFLPKFGNLKDDVEVSLPKLALITPKTDLKEKGKDLDGLPSIEISLPKPRCEAKLAVPQKESVETIKRPGIKLPVIDISVQDPGIDLHLPKPKGAADIEAKGELIKGSQDRIDKLELKMPVISLPKPELGRISISTPKADSKCPLLDIITKENDTEVKDARISVPQLDISVPKFMPSFKSPDQAEETKYSKISLPTFEISLPKIKRAESDVSDKGGKINIPVVDISLPKLKTSESDSKLESTGGGRISIPQVDISPPGIKSEDGNKNVWEGGKFRLPTLSKMKASKKEVDIECPEMTGVKLQLPKVDIAIPKPISKDAESDVEGHKGLSGKFKIPTFDVLLPKLKGHKEASDIRHEKGYMPQIDISLPKLKSPTAEAHAEGHDNKDGKLKMPRFEILLPTMKSKEAKIADESHKVKGGKSYLPKMDISLPQGKSQEIVAEVECRDEDSKLYIPKVDVLLPKLKLPEEKITESQKSKDSRIHMPTLDVSLPKIKSEEGGMKTDISVSKGTKVNLPSLDISLPNLKLPEENIFASRGKKDEMNLQTTPVKIPAVNIKVPKFDIDLNLPRGKKDAAADVHFKEKNKEKDRKIDKGPGFPKLSHGIKFGKGNIPDISLSIPKGKTDVSRCKAEVDIKPPKLKHEDKDPEIDTHDSQLKLPTLKIPKLNIVTPKLPDIDLNVKGTKDREEASINLTGEDRRPEWSDIPEVEIKIPKILISEKETETEVKAKKGKIAISEKAEESYDDHVKYKFKMPKLSMPRLGSKEAGVDAAGAKADPESRAKIPSIELSLPAGKVSGGGLLFPKAQMNVSEADTKEYEGKFKMPKMPTVNISAPKIDLGVGIPKDKREVSFGSSRCKEGASDQGFEGKDFKLRIPKVTLPSFNVSSSNEENIECDTAMGSKDIHTHADYRFSKPKVKMPDVDISIPQRKSGENVLDVKADRTFKPKIKIPKVNILGNTDEAVRSHTPAEPMKMKIPVIDILVPKGNMKLDIGLPKGEGAKGKNTSTGSPKLKMGKDAGLEIHGVKKDGEQRGQFKMKKSGKGAAEMPVENKEKVQGKFQMPKITLPSIDFSIPKEGTDISVPKLQTPELSTKSSKFKIPDLEISGSKGTKAESSGSTEHAGKTRVSEAPSVSLDPMMGYEGPKMPRVKKAVFVLLNPSQSFTSLSDEVGSVEPAAAKARAPKSEMKWKEDKESTKQGKKDRVFGADREKAGIRSNITSREVTEKVGKGKEEIVKPVKSRTEMERQSSESPIPKLSLGFFSGRATGEAEYTTVTKREGQCGEVTKQEISKGKSSLFKVSEFKLNMSSITRMTPESSPQSSRDSLQRPKNDEPRSSYKMQMPSVGFSSHTTPKDPSTFKEG
ncbi:protein AHNAK2 [Brienomyrus brachyistius]|uniref:protein AHNAK2 n=1 Tax=Brienomyrus brachyistius TaxID=42636 RepID=UPI0020B28F4B|nr:protein AHNAK2 [Brienomyrus brachyistius]